VQAKKFPSDGTLWENDLQTADTSKCDSGVCDKLKAVLWAFCLLSEHRFFDFSISVYEKQNTNYFIPTFPLFGFFDLQNKHQLFASHRSQDSGSGGSTIASPISHRSVAVIALLFIQIPETSHCLLRMRTISSCNFWKGLFN
jgi:hypothetical protein